MIVGKKLMWVAGGFIALWLGIRYVLPVTAPFLFGALLALAAEPAVNFATRKGHLPRGVAAPLAVGGTLLLMTALLSLLGAAAVREIGSLVHALPDLQQTALDGVQTLQNYLTDMAEKAPEGVRPLLTDTLSRVFSDGTAVMDQVADRLPGVIGTVLGAVPDRALGFGTGILAAFMISARLPKLKAGIAARIPEKWKMTYLPAIARLRRTLWGWLKAQLTLALITWGIVTVGFLLMKIPFAPAWASLVALVDAVPLLGTGTVLGPCAVVCVLQGKLTRALSYLGVYLVAVTVRTALEPRLVGRHLGLDPLATLFAIYLGYRFWGFLGLIFAPILASAVLQLGNTEKL